MLNELESLRVIREEEGSAGRRARVTARNVWKRHRSSRTKEEILALRDFSITIYDGEFVSILGPSGCGKTTFLRMVAGFDHPSEGTIECDGRPIMRPGPSRGMMFQAYALFPWLTVRQNIEFGPRVQGVPKREFREMADRYIEMVGLKGFENKYPHELSGGMQQRTALARMFINDPSIMLMDEPMAAVDAQTREMLQEELLSLWSSVRKTVIFVTHSIEEAVFLSDRIVVMTQRPGTVKTIVECDLPRPRTAGTRNIEEFYRLCAKVSALVREELASVVGGQ